MANYTNPMHVTFVLEYCTITTTVSDPDVDDRVYIIDQAAETIGSEVRIFPKKMAQRIIVTNKYGEQIEEADPPNTSTREHLNVIIETVTKLADSADTLEHVLYCDRLRAISEDFADLLDDAEAGARP